MAEQGFEMAFGFINKPLPSSYGTWKLTYHSYSDRVEDATDPRGFRYENVIDDTNYDYTRCQDKEFSNF
jgi:hypothetical protein